MSTIDITDRYFNDHYLEGGPPAWTVDRTAWPVRGVVVHHTAGWYGPELTPRSTMDDELVQLDACAAHHRASFGVGPGYHFAALPSGRLYAIGKWGTHRAHTRGRHADSLAPYNLDTIGIVAFGEYETNAPSSALVAAVQQAIAEVFRIAGTPLAVLGHGEAHALAVTSSGAPLNEATACPGRHLLVALRSSGTEPPAPGIPAAPAPAGDAGGAAAALEHIRSAARALELADAILTGSR